MQERRKCTRSRVLKVAKLVIGGSATVECVVRNLTNDGARIELSGSADLPENLDMTFDGGHSFRPCRLAWRSATASGLQFL
jgi:hypothetical protein